MTNSISSFYDQYPCPSDDLVDHPPEIFDWRFSFETLYSHCFGSLPAPRPQDSKLKILDAGCGTGLSTNYLAHFNPGSDILAIDISQRSLDIAAKRLSLSGANNKSKINLLKIDILEFKDCQKFDYINSIGALHHLQSPSSGLEILASLLKDGGIIHLFLYAERGRRYIQDIKNALRILDLDSLKDLPSARQLFDSLHCDNFIKQDYTKRWQHKCRSDATFADTYLHPYEKTFTLKKLLELIDCSGLHFLNFSDSSNWCLDRLLQGELLEKAKLMPELDQLKLVECLNPDIGAFDFFASKGDLKKSHWLDDDEILATSAKISHCICGLHGKVLHNYDNEQIEVDDNGLKLLEAIKKDPGLPLGLLSLDLDKSAVASAARCLYQTRVILLYPK